MVLYSYPHNQKGSSVYSVSHFAYNKSKNVKSTMSENINNQRFRSYMKMKLVHGG
jgi:hypothetical protein